MAKKQTNNSSFKDSAMKFIFGSNYEKKKLQQTVQDLIEYKKITDKGVILADNCYFAILEVSQLNSHLLDFMESSQVWLNFSTMLNSINMRHTYLLQNHYFDVSDFVKDYEQASRGLNNLTPQLIEARDDVLDYYNEFSESRNLEQKGYIMYRFNPQKEGLEMELATGNAKIDNLFKQIKTSANHADEEENESIAFSMLDEVCDLTYHMLYAIGCPIVRLNREGVLDYMYGVLNRDSTVHQRLSDAYKYDMFNPTKKSATPNVIVDVIDGIQNEDLFSNYYENNTMEYKDDPVFIEKEITLTSEIIENENETNMAFEQAVIEEEIETDVKEDILTSSTFESLDVEIENIEVENKEIEKNEVENNEIEHITNDKQNIVNLQSYSIESSEGLTKQEKQRLRRAKARREKREREKLEKQKGLNKTDDSTDSIKNA